MKFKNLLPLFLATLLGVLGQPVPVPVNKTNGVWPAGNAITAPVAISTSLSTLTGSVTDLRLGTVSLSALGLYNALQAGPNITLSYSGNTVSISAAAETGLVSSVSLSGGTTGLTWTVTNPTTQPSGTLSGTLSLSNGGTGATTANGALANIGAQTLSAVLTGVTAGTYTGSTAITQLGTIATGTWQGTILSVLKGGTGTSTPGLVQGTNITITGTWPNQTISSASNSGTLTSLTLSGGTTGLNFTTTGSTSAASTTLSGILAVANGGTGTSSPGLVQGSNITITGTWPNQTIAASGAGAGTVTSVAGTTGRVSTSGSTSAVTVTLPTTLTLSDTTLFLGTISGATVFNAALTGSGSLTTSGSAIISGSLAGTLVGTNDWTLTSGASVTSPFGAYGVIGGGQASYGPNFSMQGAIASMQQLNPLQNAVNQVVNSGSRSSVVPIGDSVGYFVSYYLAQSLTRSYGQVGTNLGPAWGGLPAYTGAESLSGTAVSTTTTVPPLTYNFDGHWTTLSASDTVTYPTTVGGIPSIYANQIRFKIITGPTFGTYTLQTSSNGTSFSNVSGVTVSYSSDGLNWTSTTAAQVGISASVSTLGVRLINVPINSGTATFSYARVVNASGSIVSLVPDFEVTGIPGFAVYQAWLAGMDLSSMQTTTTAITQTIMNAWNPSAVTLEFVDGASTTWSNALSSMSSVFGNWGYIGIAIPPIGNGTTQNLGASSAETQNAAMALWAKNGGYPYIDGNTIAKSYANVQLYLPGYDVHPPAAFNRAVGSLLIEQSGINDLADITLPNSVNGRILAADEGIYFSPNLFIGDGNSIPITASFAAAWRYFGGQLQQVYTTSLSFFERGANATSLWLAPTAASLSGSLTASMPLILGVGGTDSGFTISKSSNDGANASFVSLDTGSISSATANYMKFITRTTTGSAITNLTLSTTLANFSTAVNITGALTVSGTITPGGVAITGSISGTQPTTASAWVTQTSGLTGVSLRNYFPGMGLNTYFNGSAFVAIGNGFAGTLDMNPGNGDISMAGYSTTYAAGASLTTASISQTWFTNGKSTFPNTTAGTASNAAAVTYSGGIGVQKDSYFGQVLFATTLSGTNVTNGVPIVGTNTTSDAAAGRVGEIISSLVASGSAVSLATNTTTNATSISLTAGDWDVEGNVSFNADTVTVTAMSAGITTTSATVPSDGSEGYSGALLTAASAIDTITLPRKRISLSATTTVYLVGRATFTGTSDAIFGAITARRVR